MVALEENRQYATKTKKGEVCRCKSSRELDEATIWMWPRSKRGTTWAWSQQIVVDSGSGRQLAVRCHHVPKIYNEPLLCLNIIVVMLPS